MVISQTSETAISEYMQSIKDEKDSVGSMIEVEISNVPIGLGDPVFEKLDANLAKAIMSIPGVKGLEFGNGFGLAKQKGSEGNDLQNHNGFLSNHQGGIVGGVSNGNNIRIRVAVRAPSSIGKPQKAIKNDEMVDIQIVGRHDVCLVPRILPVIESMIQLVFADAITNQDLISQSENNLNSLREVIDKIDEDILLCLFKRLQIVKMVKKYKKENDIPVYDEKRENELMERLVKIGNELDISENMIKDVWDTVIKEGKKL